MGLTVVEIADRLGVDRTSAYQFVTALVALGLAERVGVRRPEGVGGRGENVYSFDENATKKIGVLMKKLVH